LDMVISGSTKSCGPKLDPKSVIKMIKRNLAKQR